MIRRSAKLNVYACSGSLHIVMKFKVEGPLLMCIRTSIYSYIGHHTIAL
jgi:hypothetical protein